MISSSGAPGCRYRLDDRLAVGGAGEVWRATDVLLRRQVAVKVLRPRCAPDAGMLARFRAEARHAGALSHENIARIYDYDEPPAPDAPFVVMELVNGPSAAAVLADGPMDPVRVMDIIAQAAAGLAAAHRAGLVHGGITPGRLLLAPGDVVKITKFGLSSPEPGSDLYSLGVAARACLSGAAPAAGLPGPAAAVAGRGRPGSSLPESVPSAVVALVAELTADDPAVRPGSAAEVARRAAELRDQMTHRVPVCATSAPGDAASVARARPASAPGRSPAGGRQGHRVALAAGAVVAAVMSLGR